ncbi:type II secretion system protein [Ochrobactrum sp. MYb29]|nr:type II secretion system protein [Ochrobactrum sp. MYb29]
MRVTEVFLFIFVSVSVYLVIMAFISPFIRGRHIKYRIRTYSQETSRSGGSVQYQHNLRSHVTNVVDRLNLKARLADEKTYETLRSAGFRGENPVYTFLFLRFALPFAALLIGIAVVSSVEYLRSQTFIIRFLICILFAYAGFYAPNIYVAQRIKKRLASISDSWPDALDLTIICTESGMTVESAFRKVATEIGLQSTDLAQELMLTVAELSLLPERRAAYDNLADRVKLEQIRPVTLALIQAERYGTPIGEALRTLSKEAREARVIEAERKAAALPPKLTVPMIVFFLPVLFAFIIGPAIIRLTH